MGKRQMTDIQPYNICDVTMLQKYYNNREKGQLESILYISASKTAKNNFIENNL